LITRLFSSSKRSFSSLSEQEILALAISSEEDDARIYRSYSEGLRADYPSSAEVFDSMAEEEDEHRKSLISMYQKRFGNTIPLIRREHVRGYYERKPDWLTRPLNLEKTREQAEQMERQAERFYRAAVTRTTDADTRRLLGDLAQAESDHQVEAARLEQQLLPDGVREEEDNKEKKQFLLTYVQPGLAGLIRRHTPNISGGFIRIRWCWHFDGIY